MGRVLRARAIWPVAADPIENGAVELKDGRIERVGRWIDLKQELDLPVEDLGEVVLIPGLINAHCHLDYTKMAGQLPPPSSFPDWIKSLLEFKAHWSYADFAQSWVAGARMLLESGVTTVFDIEAVPELLPEVWESTPLRTWSFFEMTGVQKRRDAAQLLQEVLDQIDRLPKLKNKQATLSPHAPYSIPPRMLELAGRASVEKSLPLQIHAAESVEEFQMFKERRGPLYDWLKPQRDMNDCLGLTPIQNLHRTGVLGPLTALIHVNYLGPGDAELIARSRASIVHCPRSHDYFRHREFPFKELLAAGINISLGTDSLASTRRAGGHAPALELWREMQCFVETHGVHPKTAFEMVTLNPARSINQSEQLGTIRSGAHADLAALEYTGVVAEKILAEKLMYEPRLRASWIAGEAAVKMD